MARAGGGYSRLIAWLKILLPLAALALLSTIFLFSEDRETLENVPFADAMEQGEVAETGVSSPYYSGTTQDGDLLTMTARRAHPLAGGEIQADTLEARILLKDGSSLRLQSRTAQVIDGEKRLDLTGGVTIESSQGYILQTEALRTFTNRVQAATDGRVTGTGPLGELEAGRLEVVPADAAGAVQMHFTGGVKLIYQPPTKEDTE